MAGGRNRSFLLLVLFGVPIEARVLGPERWVQSVDSCFPSLLRRAVDCWDGDVSSPATLFVLEEKRGRSPTKPLRSYCFMI